jgi:signal transduction histidine kinase
LVAKDRLESALKGLIHPGELESLAILGATGETIASAGSAIELTPEMMRARGAYWHGDELTLMNLMDFGAGEAGETARPAAFVVNSPRVFRPRSTSQRMNEGRPAASPEVAGEEGATTASPLPWRRFPFSRPPWLSTEDYETLISKQGVHSLVIALSTTEMRRAVRNDFVLRSLVSLLACGAALISALAWRNFSRNAELQIRLVKVGEMNSHLSQMNFAAAGLAHETRNPLNLIRGLAQMIAMQPQDSPKLRENASAIIEEADRVTVQLNEFIDYSKPRQAHLAPVEVAGLVADVVRTLRVDVEDKHIQLEAATTTLTVQADEQLFRQALFNLLLNAVQAVAPGGRIEVRWVPTSGDEVALEIVDDGPGVPEADRANIFKPYVTMRPKGVGLGLAIVHQIVAAHRWEIGCLANTPRGAIFRINHLRTTGLAT